MSCVVSLSVLHLISSQQRIRGVMLVESVSVYVVQVDRMIEQLTKAKENAKVKQ